MAKKITEAPESAGAAIKAIKAKSGSKRPGISGFFRSLSFSGMRKLIDDIIEEESDRGIFREPPEAVVDIAFNNIRGRYFASVWDRASGKIRPAAFADLNKVLLEMKENGMTSAGVLLPGATPFGTCCTSQFISSPSPLSRTELMERFGRLSGVNAAEEDCVAGGTVCYAAESEYRYLFSATKNDVLRNIEDKIIGNDVFDESFMASRAIDRVAALSNYAVGRIARQKLPEADVVMCAEQSGDRVTLWNLCRLRNGRYAPLKSATETIPKIESVETLSNRFVLFQQQLARERNFPMPGCGLIITDGTRMLDGLFAVDDLIEVCMNCADLEEEKIFAVKEEGAAIKGLFEMEKMYAENRRKILNEGKEAV